MVHFLVMLEAHSLTTPLLWIWKDITLRRSKPVPETMSRNDLDSVSTAANAGLKRPLFWQLWVLFSSCDILWPVTSLIWSVTCDLLSEVGMSRWWRKIVFKQWRKWSLKTRALSPRFLIFRCLLREATKKRKRERFSPNATWCTRFSWTKDWVELLNNELELGMLVTFCCAAVARSLHSFCFMSIWIFVTDSRKNIVLVSVLLGCIVSCNGRWATRAVFDDCQDQNVLLTHAKFPTHHFTECALFRPNLRPKVEWQLSGLKLFFCQSPDWSPGMATTGYLFLPKSTEKSYLSRYLSLAEDGRRCARKYLQSAWYGVQEQPCNKNETLHPVLKAFSLEVLISGLCHNSPFESIAYYIEP